MLFAQHSFKFILHVSEVELMNLSKQIMVLLGNLCNLEQILKVSRSRSSRDFFFSRQILKVKVLSLILLHFLIYSQVVLQS